MANPSLEDDGLLREWAPLTGLLNQIPLKAQRGLFTQDLNLTCVDALPEFIAVGTNLGLVYWYNRKTGDLQRLRCESTASAITCVKVISTVDYMVAAGNDQGIVTVFQIPKIPPDTIPESMKPKKNKQVERYTISGLHCASVTAIEWSMNGMKLFSGDKNGLVVQTEIDFYMHLSKSTELLNETFAIVQLSYSQQLLLVSTLYRSIVCHKEDKLKVSQVGQKERKSLGRLGATFCLGSGRPQELVLYASRPGLRLWLADKNGVVQQTLIYKDALSSNHPQVPLINPAQPHLVQSRTVDHQFGPLHVFRENLLVTYSSNCIYVLNPANISVVATVTDLRSVQDVSVNKDEIFVLEGDRSLLRVAYTPENAMSVVQGSKSDSQSEMLFTIPVSLADMPVASSIMDLTSRIKESAIVPAIPFPKISNKIAVFGNGSSDYTERAVVPTADEATELPPVVPVPVDSLMDLNIASPSHLPTEGYKTYKEVYNKSQQRKSSSNKAQPEILDKIGQQEYEDVQFKPRRMKKRIRKEKQPSRICDAESGSDTMSTSSIRSTSEGEDQWNSEHLDISSDWSLSTKANETKRSSSEETLVRTNLGDEDALSLCKNKDRRPEDLCLRSVSGMECPIPPEIQPDLRSPTSIERDIAEKERILAKVLNLDTLYPEGQTEAKSEDLKKNAVGENNVVDSPTTPQEFTDPLQAAEENKSSSKDELDSNCSDSILDEKLPSISSVLSYGPPSGSSAPPSNHASLEIYSSPETNGDSEAVKRADKWIQYKVPDSVQNLAICKHYVCCVDAKDVVYYSALNGLSLKWQKLDYKAKQVAASPDGTVVWKLYKNKTYALEKPSTKGPFGGEWREVADDVACMSIDDDIAWYITSGGALYVQKVSSERPYSFSSMVFTPWPVSRVCSFHGAVLILNTKAEAYYRFGTSQMVPEGREWKKIHAPCPVIIDVALGCRNTAWLVDQKNTIYFSCNYMTSHAEWWQLLISEYIFQQTTPLQHFRNKLTENYLSNLRTQSATMVISGDDTVWVADKMANCVHMNKTEFMGHRWNKVEIRHFMPFMKWSKISAEGIFEDKGQLWMLSAASDLFCSKPNSEILHGLPLPTDSAIVCMSAAPQTLWLLTNNGRIHMRQGISDISPDGSSWKELSLAQLADVHLVYVSCGCDVVWACDDQGEVYLAVGPPHTMADSTFSPVWLPVDDKAQRKYSFGKVFVGPQTYMVWALDNKGNVYVREGIFNDYQVGTGWVLVSGIEAIELSVSDTAVWALTAKGYIYRRYGISQTNFIGDYWKKIPGHVTALSASVSDGLWALDKNDSLLRHGHCTIRMNEDVAAVEESFSMTDGEWEVL